MNNLEKNKVYIDLMKDLKKAIKNEFYYEAIFIEYAILEDRTSSILKHSQKRYEGLTLNEKLNNIKKNSKLNNNYCKKHLNVNLINYIYDWKNDRNKFIHDLVKNCLNKNYVKKTALSGYELVKKVNSKSTLINNYLDMQFLNNK